MYSSRGRLRNQVVSTLVCFVMNNWLTLVWIWIREILVVLPYYLYCLENRVFLSWGVQVIGAIWWAATRIMVGVGDLVQRTRDGQAQVRYLVAGWLRGQVTLCVVYTVHKETSSASFLIEPQNQGRRVSRFGPQNWQLQFGDLAHKITASVSWFGPQNQVGYSLSVVP
jgi:hypothetical protein